MSTEIRTVPASDSYWNHLLELVPHDIYHTREYHMTSGFGVREPLDAHPKELNDVTGEHRLLFSYQKSDMVFLFPYVLRTLEDILGEEGRSYFDVTSVYGYGGPLASVNASPRFLTEAWSELLLSWREANVISAFTRFHPLLQNVRLAQAADHEAALFGGPAALLCGKTVSINLLKPDAEQFQQYQKNVRNQVRKAYSSGFTVGEADFESTAETFVALYTQTMHRRNAPGQYLIDRNWLVDFTLGLNGHCFFLSAVLDDQITAMLLVMEYRGLVHAHLTGIDDRFTSHSPLKPLIDGARRWATSRGNRIFHLGGGIGAREDSLFQFKRHFSPDLHPFHIGCWILNRRLYDELSGDAGRETYGHPGLTCDEPRPFPAYRFIHHELRALAGENW